MKEKEQTKIIEEINDLVKNNPNDADLGAAVRTMSRNYNMIEKLNEDGKKEYLQS